MKYMIISLVSVLGFVLIFAFSNPGSDLENVYDNYSLMQPLATHKLSSTELENALKEQDKTVAGVPGTKGSSSSTALACPFGDLIVKEANAQGLDPLLVAAVISQESDFQKMPVGDPDAYNGLMQVGEESCEQVGEANPADIFDPETNLRIGTKYLKYCIDLEGGDIKGGLAAYNWGPGYYAQYLKGRKTMPEETVNYIRQIPDRYEAYKAGTLPVGQKGSF